MGALKLFLFDLDGTLIQTGGAGLKALGTTFEKIYGIKEAQKTVNPSGKTDPAIFRELIQLHLGRDITQQDTDKIIPTYLRYLSIEVRYSKTYRVLPGVQKFLDFIIPRGDILIGLGTGNLEKGARLKLSRSRISSYFPFGGFGSDSENRAEILQAGHHKAEERCGRRIPPHQVFIFGDTPLDVKAGREAGFKTVAVASGMASPEELENSNPDFLLGQMSEAFAFLKKADKIIPPIKV